MCYMTFFNDSNVVSFIVSTSVFCRLAMALHAKDRI